MIDLHAHSNRFDSTDDPAALVRKAKAAGLSVVALTDHDTTVGWSEAIGAAAEVGIVLVCGLEVSVGDGGQGHHLLACEPDTDDEGLQAMLARSIAARDERIPAMVARIANDVPTLRLEDVLAIAGSPVAGRPYLADALVWCGASPDRAFAEYLVPGRPTYLETWSPPLEDAIRIITAAGGFTVIAHPWGRNTYVSPERFSELSKIGMVGIEVGHQEHNPQMRQELRRIALGLWLLVTGSPVGAYIRVHDATIEESTRAAAFIHWTGKVSLGLLDNDVPQGLLAETFVASAKHMTYGIRSQVSDAQSLYVTEELLALALEKLRGSFAP